MRTAIALILAALIIGVTVWFTVPIEFGERESPPKVDPDYVPELFFGTIKMPGGTQQATVNYVHDGDTIFLTTAADPNLKVRLLAVDTPELEDCYGDVATDFTRALLSEGSTVYTLADTEPLDQYGRSLLFVWTADGELVNYSLVAEGMAEAVFIGENRLYEEEFERGENEARDAGLGTWGSC